MALKLFSIFSNTVFKSSNGAFMSGGKQESMSSPLDMASSSAGRWVKSHFPDTALLHQYFEWQVEQSPDEIALCYLGERFSYEEINRRANRLAYHLRETYWKTYDKAIEPGALIALYLDRGWEVIVSMLAILKIGAAYIPLSPEHPEERTRFILEDIQAELIISQDKYTERLGCYKLGSSVKSVGHFRLR